MKKSDRVYVLLVRDNPHAEKKRWGVVESDEIEGWDYIDVRFDDFPGLVQPVLVYYLYREDEKLHYLSSFFTDEI